MYARSALLNVTFRPESATRTLLFLCDIREMMGAPSMRNKPLSFLHCTSSDYMYTNTMYVVAGFNTACHDVTTPIFFFLGQFLSASACRRRSLLGLLNISCYPMGRVTRLSKSGVSGLNHPIHTKTIGAEATRSKSLLKII